MGLSLGVFAVGEVEAEAETEKVGKWLCMSGF